MKKTCLIVAYVLCIILPGLAFGQQQVSLKKALEEVREVYGTRFSYEEHLLDNITVQKKGALSKNEPVENVLKDLLYNNGFLFLYVQKNYYTIIKDNRKQNTPPSQPGQGTAVESAPAVIPDYVQTITGRVTDIDGKPLIGATVIPDGYAISHGVTTNSEGDYTLRLRVKTTAVVFSYIGMVPQKLPIDGKAMLNVQLEYEPNSLSNVSVVSNGYQTVPKERATGSFSIITAKDIKEVPAVNIMEKLEGTTPGVRFDVRNNTITIRGVNSYTANEGSSPLIVVDGFPAIEQTLTERLNGNTTAGAVLSRYNPEDIESISVLKDAAATSIWGAKAANGVIVITTKKGQKNSSKVNFSSNLSVSSPVDINNLDRMGAADYVDLEREMFNKNYYYDPTSWDFNKPATQAVEWMFKARRGTITAQQRDSALNVLSSYNNTGQIRDLLLQKAVSQQYNVSLSGGGQNSTYYLSTNYTKDIPVFKSNKGESYFLTANLTNNLFNNKATLTTGINYNYATSVSNQAAVNAIGSLPELSLTPYDMLQDANGNLVLRNVFLQDKIANNLVSKGYMPWTYNPVQELNYNNGITKANRFRFNAALNAKITGWLSLDVSGSLQRTTGETNTLNEIESYATRKLVNEGTSVQTNGKLLYGVPFGGKLVTTNAFGNSYSLRGQFNVNKSWSHFTFNALAGSEIREERQRSYTQTRYGYNADTRNSASYNPTVGYMTIYGYNYTLGYSDGAVGDKTKRYLSYFSNAAFGAFNNRYILSGSIRFDDYSMMGVSRSQRAKPLWSAGAKWNVLSESFMKNVNWVNNLNVRLTYGTGGAIPTSATNAAILSLGSIGELTGEQMATIQRPANNTLGWELTKTWNTGLDLGLLKNRLTITADYYTKKTSDILYNLPVNGTYGWTTLQFNAASMKGHGIDLGITGQIIQSRDFGWTSTFNISYNTNEVTDSRFAKATDINLVTSATPTVGLPIGYMYAYRWAGLDTTGHSQIFNKDGKKVGYKEGNNVITAADLVYEGRTTPPFFGGFLNTFTYKGVTLGVRMTYEMGHVFRRNSIANYPDFSSFSGAVGAQKDLARRWRKRGDEAFTNVPGLDDPTTNNSNRYKYSDLLTLSASHIRLQQLSLGYQLSNKLLAKTPVKSASFTVTARNPGIIWRKNKEGIDPSYIATNSYTNLPPTTAWFFGLNVGF